MAGTLEGKVAVVTGGASGIGEASVVRFVHEGAFVFVVDRSGREAEVAARYPQRAEAVNVDVTSPARVRDLFKLVDDRFGRLSILFNNACTGGLREDLVPIMQNRDEHIESMLAINLKSVLFCIKYAVPLLQKAGGGSIINTASSAALMAQPNLVAYAAAKAGVVSLTRTIARELGTRNIRVNAICPGPIETPLLSYYLQDTALRGQLIAATALQRLGRPEEVANTALFLASDASSYVTGAWLAVDGGISA
jgi:NAD(P)-dependent dehydrogenase (short-subunit alcohol dehydrogenase family)